MGTSRMTNSELAAHQIEKHGKDRYPTIQAQFTKLVEEVGELAKEVNKERWALARDEAVDVALALYNVAAKIGFDLDKAMREVVAFDNRKFA